MTTDSNGPWKLTAVDGSGQEVSGVSTVDVKTPSVSCSNETPDCVVFDWKKKTHTRCEGYPFKRDASYDCEFRSPGQMIPASVTRVSGAIKEADATLC